MEKTQRLIINSDVYDFNDDELEAETAAFKKSLEQKQQDANVGKDAIITATKNKTGKPITNRTYAEVVDAINTFEQKSFEVDKFSFNCEYVGGPDTVKWEIVDSLIAKFNASEAVSFPCTPLSADILTPRPINMTTAFTLSVQTNIKQISTNGSVFPYIFIYSGDKIVATIFRVSETEIRLLYLRFSDISGENFTVSNIDSYNYFEISLRHEATDDSNITIRVYGGTRGEDNTKNSGYTPTSKVLLFMYSFGHYNTISNIVDTQRPLYAQFAGCNIELGEASNGYNVGEVSIYDTGFKYSDDTQTAEIGNVDFINKAVD